MNSMSFGELYICRTDTWNTYEKIVKRYNSEGVNAASAPRKTEKAHFNNKYGPFTTADMAQAHQATDQRRTVARGANQGAPAPPALPLGPNLLWRYNQCKWRRFTLVTIPN